MQSPRSRMRTGKGDARHRPVNLSRQDWNPSIKINAYSLEKRIDRKNAREAPAGPRLLAREIRGARVSGLASREPPGILKEPNPDVTEKSPERWSRRDGKLEEDRIQRFTSNGFGKLGSPNHPSSSPDQSGQTFNFVGDVNSGSTKAVRG